MSRYRNKKNISCHCEDFARGSPVFQNLSNKRVIYGLPHFANASFAMTINAGNYKQAKTKRNKIVLNDSAKK